MKEEKTNVMRLLEQAGVDFQIHRLPEIGAVSATQAAELIGVEPERIFKTLVTVGKSGEHYVFVIPGAGTLNLKKAATVVGEKSIEMIPQKQLLPLTGYIHGGCSPIGMKKQFETVFDETALLYDKIVFSAGKIGFHIEVAFEDLLPKYPFRTEDVV